MGANQSVAPEGPVTSAERVAEIKRRADAEHAAQATLKQVIVEQEQRISELASENTLLRLRQESRK